MPSQLQHYVPQFLLRNFSANNKGQIHVFDKRTEKSFLTNISKESLNR